jgi:hypothetical protein
MLLFMIACAAAAVLLFALGVFDDLGDVWINPQHKATEDLPHHPPVCRVEETRASRHHVERFPSDTGARNGVIPMPERRQSPEGLGTRSETRVTRVV